MSNYFKKSKLPSKEVIPGITLRSAYLNDVMITMVDLEPNSVMPVHKHEHEQITYIVKGKMEMTVGDEKVMLGPDEGFVIPSNVEHGCVVFDEPTTVIDSWSPVREDYKLSD